MHHLQGILCLCENFTALCKPHLALRLLEKLRPSGMTDQECTDTTTPFFPFNHWTQAYWACVCLCVYVWVCECPAQITVHLSCKLYYHSLNFYSSCYSITSLCFLPFSSSCSLPVSWTNRDADCYLIYIPGPCLFVLCLNIYEHAATNFKFSMSHKPLDIHIFEPIKCDWPVDLRVQRSYLLHTLHCLWTKFTLDS